MDIINRLAPVAVGALVGLCLVALLVATNGLTFFQGGFSVGYPGHWFLVVSRYGVNTWHETEFIGRTIVEW